MRYIEDECKECGRTLHVERDRECIGLNLCIFCYRKKRGYLYLGEVRLEQEDEKDGPSMER